MSKLVLLLLVAGCAHTQSRVCVGEMPAISCELIPNGSTVVCPPDTFIAEEAGAFVCRPITKWPQ